ncbi:MAG: glycosyltransferase, partial [Muribaculaceae bacterium]|nr:glycosyltransferase [Muribaculaceae bacterium]
MKKPRIFIHMHYMALGGAERALLGLLNALDSDRVDVDLFLNQHTGELMSLIPDKINLLSERKGYNAIERPMKTILKERQFSVLFGRLIAKLLHWRYRLLLRESKKSYDCSGFQYVADCVNRYLEPL